MSVTSVSKAGNGISKSVVKKWTKMIESFQDKSFIKPSKKEAFAQMLENEMKFLPKALQENVSSAGSFLTTGGTSALGSVPFYIGVIRRGFPKLVGMNLMGVQPLTIPGGVIFAVQRTYKGNQNEDTSRDITQFNSRLVISSADFEDTDLIGGIYENDGSGGLGDKICNYKIIYSEDGSKFLLKLSSFESGKKITDIVDGTSDTASLVSNDGATVAAYFSAVFENFAVYDEVFRNYSKFRDTDLGINNDEFDGSNIREVGNDVKSVPVQNIINRKIRSKISQEVIEDMQAYKYDIQNDLMNIMLEDITAELNREFYYKLKNSAEEFDPVNFTTLSGTNAFDKYVQLISKATYLSNRIAVDLKTSVGNYMVISPALLSAYTTLSKYWNYTNDPSVGNINLKLANFATEPMVGKFNGMWDLYIDIYDYTDTIMVGHYSENNLDNAWFYLPYIPLTPDVLKDPQTGTWVLHYRTRYATLENPFGAYRWIKKFEVQNFTV